MRLHQPKGSGILNMCRGVESSRYAVEAKEADAPTGGGCSYWEDSHAKAVRSLFAAAESKLAVAVAEHARASLRDMPTL